MDPNCDVNVQGSIVSEHCFSSNKHNRMSLIQSNVGILVMRQIHWLFDAHSLKTPSLQCPADCSPLL